MSMMIAGAIAGPFPVQINTGNHGHLIPAGGKYHAQTLVVAGITFHSIFMPAGFAVQFAFPVVDGSVFEDL